MKKKKKRQSPDSGPQSAYIQGGPLEILREGGGDLIDQNLGGL